MAQDIKQQKFETWKNGLLDVSKRNQMINFRKIKRSTLKILSPDLESLYERLVHWEESISFKVRVDFGQDAQMSRLLYLMDKIAPVVVTKGEIDTEVPVDESNRTLKQLRAKSRLSLEEQGINILYLSFGFLKWKQKGAEKEMLAPLVMVPVGLTLESFGSPYVLDRLDEDIVRNPTLAYVLSSEYGIELPEFDSAKTELSDYLNQVEQIAAPRGWQVQREVYLGLLSFLKIVMYRDLEKYRERIFENPVIRAFCGDPSGLPQWDPALADYPHDRDGALDTWQVVNSDSSQQDALLLARKGYSFVLQGPPGTGKSQTITNMIAQGLADGKKILFVSEKMAALSVVYRRLEEADLSEYCLSLHNYKADKKKVIAELVASLDAPRKNLKNGVLEFVPQYERQKKELDDYFSALKAERAPLQRSLYHVLTELASLEEEPVFPVTESVLETTGAEYQEKLVSLQLYRDFLENYEGDIRENAWRNTNITLVTFDLQKSLEQLAGEMSIAMMGICALLDLLQEDYEVGATWNWEEYCDFIRLAAQAKALSDFSKKVQDDYGQVFLPKLTEDTSRNLTDRLESTAQKLKAETEKHLSDATGIGKQKTESNGGVSDATETGVQKTAPEEFLADATEAGVQKMESEVVLSETAQQMAAMEYLPEALDSAAQRTEELEKLRARLERIRTANAFMEEYHRYFSTEDVCDASAMEKQLAFLRAADSCAQIVPAWLEKTQYEQAKSVLKHMISLREAIYVADQDVRRWTDSAVTDSSSVSELSDMTVAYAPKDVSVVAAAYASKDVSVVTAAYAPKVVSTATEAPVPTVAGTSTVAPDTMITSSASSVPRREKITQLKRSYDVWKDIIASVKPSWEKLKQEILDIGFYVDTFGQSVQKRRSLGSEIAKLEKVRSFLDGVNRDVKMEYITGGDGLDRIRLISQILIIPYSYRLEWVTGGNQNAVLLLAGEMERLADPLRRLKEQLRRDWRDEFLTFDGDEMYRRFQVDYTSFFQRIGGQYKADRRALLSMRKNAERKLEDAVCLEGLETLGRYQQVKKEFDRKSVEAAQVFAGYYKGEDTDWGMVRMVLNRCQPLFEYYEKYGMTVDLAGLLESSYEIRRYTKLDGIWAEELASGELIREYSDWIAPYSNEFLPDVIRVKKKQAETLDALLDFRESLRERFAGAPLWDDVGRLVFLEDEAHPTARIDTFFFGIEQVEERLDTCMRAVEAAKPEFPGYDLGLDTDWDALKSSLDQAEPLVSYASENPLTDAQVAFAGRPREERQNTLFCRIPLSVWMDEEHRSQLWSVWDGEEPGVSADQLAQKYEGRIRAIEEYDALAREMASCFRHPTSCATVSEMAVWLRDYADVSGFLNREREAIERRFAEAGIGDFWRKSEGLFQLLEEYVEQAEEAAEAAFRLFRENRASQKGILHQMLSEIRVSLPEEAVLRRYGELFEEDVLALPLRELSGRSRDCGNMEALQNWLLYCTRRRDCAEHGLESYLAYLEKENTVPERILPIFRKSFLTRWVLEWLNREELQGIRQFQSYSHERLIRSFRTYDRHMLKVNRARLNAKLSAEKPSGHSQALNGRDEISTLLRENEKKRKVMPLRRLFREIPMLLQKLKPCFMMSPLSVSYFLDSDVYQFDMVIFDEASQILPEDAIGAIYRGRQVIIAGDTNQLPPTNFFAASARNEEQYDSNTEEDEEHYYETVSESILDEANQCLPYKCTLLWHYRSRDESLIAFSNRRIYGNRLTTFPNCRKEADKGLEYVYVKNGCYEGGGKNCNVEEAKRCVELLEEHVKKHPERSLGIIAFSEKQQGVISDAVQEWRQKNPIYEEFFHEDQEEPFFVKNLESVQGDERDTIIISICYARNRDGKMTMNFGPLSHAGGERRLNVAITRAKYNVKLVGSIRPEDMDVRETTLDGTRFLREYIAYAMARDYELPEGEDMADAPDQFPNIIGKFVEENGYHIRRNVGESQYRVDVAIRHPHQQDTYMAGIECDGENYASARTARDRDYLRQDMMQSIGWKLYHVWSLAWYKNPQYEKKRLLNFLEKAAESPTAAVTSVEDVLPSPNTQEMDVGDTSDWSKQERDLCGDDESLTTQEAGPQVRELKFEQYIVCDPWDAEQIPGAEDSANLERRIFYVLQQEQPIHTELLYRRLATVFGKQKATEPVRRTVEKCMRERMRGKIRRSGDFVYLKDAGEIKARRQNGEERPIEYICPEELRDAMIRIVAYAYGIDRDDLLAETARVFGFARRGAKISEILTAELEELLGRGVLRMSDEKVYMGGGAET